MQLGVSILPPHPDRLNLNVVQVGHRTVPLRFIRNRRARRYILRVKRDGAARITIPIGGSPAEGWAFAQKHSAWIEQQLLRIQSQDLRPQGWFLGTEILFRGQPVRIDGAANGIDGLIQFADQIISVSPFTGNLRPIIEFHLRCLAASELDSRTRELAAAHQLLLRRVVVRNQRTRWGSCSAKGTISLNWRLIQAPPWVCDYLILHELMHLREMNHSERFWRCVQEACPQFAAAEVWLKKHEKLLR